jgi:hypothetical protein
MKDFLVVLDFNSDVLVVMHVLHDLETDAGKEVNGLARFEGIRGVIVAKEVESLSYVQVVEGVHQVLHSQGVSISDYRMNVGED